MARILNKDPAIYLKERDSFIQELQHFHETRGTPSRKTPKINGQDVDLYLLYSLVTTRGGWLKVNSRNEWDQLLEHFKVPKHCVNSAVALKQIYLRYLDRYEKVHYLGEVGERANDDDEDSRHRRWSARALHSVPLTYNYHQHIVNESLRNYNGLSTELYKPSEYDRLVLSLMSPLPNEQDFAINVCTLLSNEGKHTLKLEKHPRLLHFLLAHTAVFNHTSTRDLFNEVYSRIRGHSLNHFWPDVLEGNDLRPLLDEKLFIKRPKKKSTEDSEEQSEDESKSKDVAMTSEQCESDIVVCESGERAGLKFEPEDRELFCLGRTLGTQDYIGQRVLQIAMILRNLTFAEENIELMAKDTTFIRFIILCCGSRWNSLHQMGLDMLGNIASDIELCDPLLKYLLSVINSGLESSDRCIVLSCIEILNKLGQNEKNEEILLRCLEEKVYERVCSFLTLHDIMLLVHTLECLYSLSSLGERACNSIVRVHGALDTLVSLVTVEAQSYGPKACILMRVVETVSGGVPGQQPSLSTQTTPVAAPVPSSANSVQTITCTNLTTVSAIPALPLPTPAIARPVTTPSPAATPPPTLIAVSTSSSSAFTSTQTSTQQRAIAPNPAHATQQVAQENEQFALAWLRATFEPSSTGGRIEQGELYKQYINSCAKIGRRGVIAPLHFPRCVRSVFGGSVGPKPLNGGDTNQQFYEGIQVRGKLFPSSTPITPASPILKAQLSAPPKPTPSPPTPPKKETKSKVSAHPHLSQALLGGGGSSPPPAPIPPSDGSAAGGSSSLIKSLLASKVCEMVPPNTSSMPSTVDQVTQRQQQQRLLQAQQQPVKSLNNNSKPLTATIKPAPSCRINGVRTPFQQFEVTIDGKLSNDSSESNDGVVTSSTQPGLENHISGPPPPPLAPLSGGGQRFTQQMRANKIEIEDSDSTGNNSLASSSGIRDNCSATGGEEGENSLTSFEGFLLNGVPNSLDVDDTTSKDSAPKSLMLADLLEKNIEKKEPPVLNGALRIGDKGLELVQGTGIKAEKEQGNGTTLKRPPSRENGCDTEAKRPHMNGDASPDEPPEEGNVSSSAANLYAALAAETALDDDTDELEQNPPQQLIVTTTTPRQILVSAGGQISIPQRVSVMGQHYVVAQPQTALVQGQTQTVLVAQTAQQQGTGAKTIIILQPQSVAAPPPPPPPAPAPTPPPPAQKVIVQRLQSPPPPVAVKVVRPITPTTPTTCTSPASPSSQIKSISPVVKPQPNRTETPQGHFLCEWRGCMRNFKSANEVYMHACESHCPSGSNEIQCLWERCDAMKRKRFSLMTHLYDRHCNADVLRMMAVRRKQLSVSGRSEIPPPTPPTPHPGYAPNAAFHAIKRHALEFVNPKELQPRAPKPGPTPSPVPVDQDDNEGPVTKSIRLTSSLILRNLVIYSSSGRRYLTSYEPHLASVALSNVESSRTIAQVLFDMSQPR